MHDNEFLIRFNAPAHHRLELTDAYEEKYAFGGDTIDGAADPEFAQQLLSASWVDVTLVAAEEAEDEQVVPEEGSE